MRVTTALLVNLVVLVGDAPPLLSFQDVASAMAASVERQRNSIDRQRASMEGQRASLDQMAGSIDRQRKTVRAQAVNVAKAEIGAESFFTIPWPEPPVPVAMASADCDPLPVDQVEALVQDSARTESLKPELLREVMRRESAFKPCAVSKAGAQGLMQLMPATAQQFGVENVFDPKQNVAAGAKFLRTLLDRYSGDLRLALGAYNAGPARVDEAGGVPAINETRNYVKSIITALPVQ